LSSSKPYRLIVKVLSKSKAKLFRLIPLKSIISGEPFEVSFHFQNISEETFPGADFNYDIVWPSQQYNTETIKVPLLKKNGSYNTPSATINALSDGFGLVYIRKSPMHEGFYVIKDEKGGLRNVHFYRGKRVEDYIKKGFSVSSIKAKT